MIVLSELRLIICTTRPQNSEVHAALQFQCIGVQCIGGQEVRVIAHSRPFPTLAAAALGAERLGGPTLGVDTRPFFVSDG